MLHRTNSFSCFQIVSLFRCTITHRFAKWYEITLLSNSSCRPIDIRAVLLPYEITLLSNRVVSFADMSEFYYLIKLHYSQTETPAAFNTSRFYYLMKLHYSQTLWHCTRLPPCFTTLWNYTTLKPQMRISCDTTIHRVTS